MPKHKYTTVVIELDCIWTNSILTALIRYRKGSGAKCPIDLEIANAVCNPLYGNIGTVLHPLWAGLIHAHRVELKHYRKRHKNLKNSLKPQNVGLSLKIISTTFIKYPQKYHKSKVIGL